MFIPYSQFSETLWPAVPSPSAGAVLGILFQLEQSQWWNPSEIAEQQARQLHVLLKHAQETVAYYRERTCDFGSMPLLSRRDVQLAGGSLHSTAVPKNHGRLRRTETGGSTGAPVQVLTTDFTDLMWRVLTLRDHLWHRRDFRQTFAAIRYLNDDVGSPPDGTVLESWGGSTRGLAPTGSAHLLNIQSTIREQAAWLRRVNPGYLLAYPSALSGIASIIEAEGWRLPNLKQVLTYGEVLESRQELERRFGVPVCDVYSSQEVGYIALQCPSGLGYHVQSENVLVEVLHESGRLCRPGEIGKVVVTALHNFAMPLIRYDIGDFAEVGVCKCGRCLPVLTRILGRQRNLLTMPDGEKRWPVFASLNAAEELPAFFQFQVIQTKPDQLELNVVRAADLTPQEQSTVEHHLQRMLQYPFQIRVNRVDSIPRSRSGKFEDFISLVE